VRAFGAWDVLRLGYSRCYVPPFCLHSIEQVAEADHPLTGRLFDPVLFLDGSDDCQQGSRHNPSDVAPRAFAHVSPFPAGPGKPWVLPESRAAAPRKPIAIAA